MTLARVRHGRAHRGDEFGVVLTGIDLEGARESAAPMHTFLSAPFDVGDAVAESEQASASPSTRHTGESIRPRPARDIAMYDAKRAGVGYSLFFGTATAASSGHDRRKLARELRGAVARRELLLHYQAAHRLRSDELAAVGSARTWGHPRSGS